MAGLSYPLPVIMTSHVAGMNRGLIHMPSKKPPKPVWDKARPKSAGKPKELTSGQKASAKSAAKAAGRPYPNLVDNMRAARKKK